MSKKIPDELDIGDPLKSLRYFIGCNLVELKKALEAAIESGGPCITDHTKLVSKWQTWYDVMGTSRHGTPRDATEWDADEIEWGERP